jgi:hypothetical protein
VQQLLWGLVVWMACWLGARPMIVSAQEDGLVTLQIWLRASDGSAVFGEPVILQQLPEEGAIKPILQQARGETCITDAAGRCTWRVQQGLYQVLFDRPLDTVSALAVAEGGLRGLGITVSDVAIADGSFAYHFTFHSDGRVYFDAAPEAAVPSPVIPELDELHGGVPATVVPPIVTDERIDVTPTRGSTATPGDAASASANTSWRILFLIGLGLVVGGILHFLRLRSGQAWTRKWRQPHKTAKKETKDA